MVSSSKDGDDTADYESDPEDSLLPSMRRREASDDEDADGDRDAPSSRKPLIGSDAESDGQGAPQVYDDEEEYEDELYEDGLEELEEEDIAEEGVEDQHLEAPAVARDIINDGDIRGVEDENHEKRVPRDVNEVDKDGGEAEGEQLVVEKKENGPSSVPTAGAFYMHDDRFRDNGRGRHRRFPGGRKLWESKDERAWVHDRFEDLNIQDSRRDEERRMPRGRFRGRGGGKPRGAGRGYARGNRTPSYDNSNNQNLVPKSVRGRGPRRYETLYKNRNEMPTSNKQYSKQQEGPSGSSSSGRTSGQIKQPLHASNVQPDPVAPLKNVFASSLSSASPPFYPTGSSSQDISATQKKDGPMGMNNRVHPSPAKREENVPTSQFVPSQRGKVAFDSPLQEIIYADNVLRPVPGKAFTSSFPEAPVSSLSSANAQASLSGPLGYKPSGPLNQVARALSPAQAAGLQPRPYHPQGQPPLRVPAQQIGQLSGSSTQAPLQALSTNSSEVREAESPPGSSKSKATSASKGQVSGQGAGKGSILYSGAQVLQATGPMGFTAGDQGFPRMPALLPVMQFGGQTGGPGVPAMGMALPGYVAQPQVGYGNSEMTWLPVLAGAGALGASYPYVKLDGSNYPLPSGQTSSVSSRDTSSAKLNSTSQPPQKSDVDEFGQRQNKPRRYSEMNFGQ